MHDIKFIREHPERFDAGLKRRGLEGLSGTLLASDRESREYQTRAQELLARRNEASKAIGAAKGAKDEVRAAELMAEVGQLKEELPKLEAASADAVRALNDALAAIPNLPAEDVPPGGGEEDNVEVKRWGSPRPAEDMREHFDIGAPLGLDFESAQAVSGARFAYLRGPVARLNRALGQFMLDTHTEKFGYQEVVPPVLVRDEAMFGTAQLPKFAEDSFLTFMSSSDEQRKAAHESAIARQSASKSNLSFAKLDETIAIRLNPANRRWLIPTAEVSLTNLVREQILPEAELPLRFVALTPCFRSEAGSAGKDTRGLIRQHQFDKVEMVSITTADQSDAEHERMTSNAEYILEALGLPYRRMLLCSGDMGFSTRKTYDLEVWLPGQGTYREISSCSTCGDFQARRMQARYRPDGQTKAPWPFVHTLNGSGLAVGRTLVAVLENGQEADGSVTVPEVLRPYMGGISRLTPGA